MRAYVFACVHAPVRACVRACVFVCTCVWAFVCARVLHSWPHSHAHARERACSFAHVHRVCVHACVRTYKHTLAVRCRCCRCCLCLFFSFHSQGRLRHLAPDAGTPSHASVHCVWEAVPLRNRNCSRHSLFDSDRPFFISRNSGCFASLEEHFGLQLVLTMLRAVSKCDRHREQKKDRTTGSPPLPGHSWRFP